jgi:D-3-phosphoglycerate dehydrogenase
VRLVRGARVLAAGDRFVLSKLILEALQREARGALEVSTLDLPWPVEPYGPVAEVEEASGTEEQMIEAVNGVEVVVTQLAPLTARVLEAANNLRLVVCTRGGPVNVNVEAASESGVAVCYAPGRNAPAAAEYAVGLMLAAMRRIPEAHGSLSSGQWRGEFYVYEECGVELDGATVGLVGFGAIGRRVARVLVAFGARVFVYDPFVDVADIEEAGGSSVELDELLERSRAVSLHARLSPDTRDMIGAHEISRMSRDSVLVNTARGGLLDYDALCDALESGHLGAAALDVYPEEPVPEDSRILKAPRLVLSPHIAGATKETAQRAARIAAEEVGRYVRGEQLLNVINSEAVGDLA